MSTVRFKIDKVEGPAFSCPVTGTSRVSWSLSVMTFLDQTTKPHVMVPACHLFSTQTEEENFCESETSLGYRMMPCFKKALNTILHSIVYIFVAKKKKKDPVEVG